MTTAGRRRGSKFEIDLLKGFRSLKFDVERLRLVGRDDEGDLVIKDLGHIYVVEAKNEARIDLPRYIAESKVEAANYAEHRGLIYEDVTPLAVVKRRGKSWLDAYVVQDVRTYFDLEGV